jgi:putative glutamine amidotransferase
MMPADPARTIFNGRPLLFVERSLTEWLSVPGVNVYVLTESSHGYEATADDLDGLVLSGGVDIAPGAYGEVARRPAWEGDPRRDAYELALFRAMLARDKPVLGICRGHQLINVALGGSLHQDVVEERPGALVHRDAVQYDRNQHDIVLQPEGALARLYPGVARARVNTVHHQAVNRLGEGLVVDALSAEDGVVEAISLPGRSFIRGIQWHPEFQDPEASHRLDNGVLREAFFSAVGARRAS